MSYQCFVASSSAGRIKTKNSGPANANSRNSRLPRATASGGLRRPMSKVVRLHLCHPTGGFDSSACVGNWRPAHSRQARRAGTFRWRGVRNWFGVVSPHALDPLVERSIPARPARRRCVALVASRTSFHRARRDALRCPAWEGRRHPARGRRGRPRIFLHDRKRVRHVLATVPHALAIDLDALDAVLDAGRRGRASASAAQRRNPPAGPREP
jgi:hypothetical protein